MRVENLKRGEEEAGVARAMVSKFHIILKDGLLLCAVSPRYKLPSSDVAEDKNLRQQLNDCRVVGLVK